MASGTSSQQQKISPRKFSEKIALLNKKEREGNAKFEEIIKEVQATRNHQQQHHVGHQQLQPHPQQQQFVSPDGTSYSCPAATTPKTTVADEIEEVYENLIRCVDQYEEELHHDGAQTMDFRSASAGLVCRPSEPFQTSPRSDNNDLDPYNRTIQQELSGSTGRARVISFGSAASYKYSCANSDNNQSNWPQTSHPNQNYLEPTNDRSRQKSCSDPALNAIPPTNNGSLPYESSTDQLPNIKICAIDDDLNQLQTQLQHHQQQQPQLQLQQHQNNGASSRDNSLPDISRIQFEGNCSPDKIMMSTYTDSCQALDGSWTSCGCPGGDNMSNFDTSTLSLCSQAQQSLGACHNQSSWPDPTIKVNNLLSNSDCGLTSSAHDYNVQHGDSMLCTSSDQFNNIMRSRSHSNIDYLMKQGRVNDTSANNENFINQHCQQLAHNKQCASPKQISMNNKRIINLKTHESSISPLGSSSNLNSPQSDLNSPGSSTTDYCDANQIYQQTINAIANPSRQEFYQYEPVANDLGAPSASDCQTWTSGYTTVGQNLNNQQDFFLQPQQNPTASPHSSRGNQNSNIGPYQVPPSVRRSQSRTTHRTFSPF